MARDSHELPKVRVPAGRLLVENGYLRLQATRMQLRSLPLPQATVDMAVRRLFDSPENREKFKLAPEIRDIRLEGGELVVSRKSALH